jgi:outer membrane protein assembly factor BamB
MRSHDPQRSGITPESLSIPLSRAWTHTTNRTPTPAWTESPARHDYLHNYYDLKPRQAFDRCFDVAVADGRVYFASSQSGTVTCLLANDNGDVVWTFFTDAPVRFAPHVVGERLYVGSDDGFMYCLDTRDGTVVWKERVGPTAEMLWGNENMISVWPVRTGVLVVDDYVYWTAGLFPEQGIYVCRRKAADGTGGWTHTLKRPAQGYLLASRNYLVVPTGKTFPLVFDRGTGAPIGDIKKSARDGGSWALIEAATDRIWSGPNTENALQSFDRATGARTAAIRGANCLVVDGANTFYNTDSELVKVTQSEDGVDRRGKKSGRARRQIVWSKKAPFPHSLIKAGALIFAGGRDRVAAFGENGEKLWEAPVDGRAFGLAAADGHLYVSTDAGSIHCFKATLPHLAHKPRLTRLDNSAATVTGYLASVGGAPASVGLYWGRKDGGTVPDAWQQHTELGERLSGTLSATIGDLETDATYYSRFAATNSYGTAWEEASDSFTTAEVAIAAADKQASEDGLVPASFTVSRSVRDTAEPLTVDYSVGGTAKAGGDYSPLSGSVVIPAGSRSATITVMPLDDLQLNEDKETVVVTIAPGPYKIGPIGTARITISDHDSMDGWRHKAKLTVTGYKGQEALNDFPALVHIDECIPGFSQDSMAQDWADLRFTDAEGSVALPYQIETSPQDGEAHVWVRIPTLTASTAICMWWGNSQCNAPPSYTTDGSTWAPHYVGVWHMNAESGTVRDASATANHGQPHDVKRAGPGVVGRGLEFDGAKSGVKLTSLLPIGHADNTLSLWINVPKVGEDGLGLTERVGVILGSFNDTPNSNWELHATGAMRWYWNNGHPDRRGKTDLRDGTWHHLAWVRDCQADKLYMYVDGEQEKEYADAGADITFTTLHAIGADNRPKGSPRFHGKMDELRIARAARPADWVRACFANQSSPGTFWSCTPGSAP